MRTITYTRMLEQQIEVQVTDEQYAALHQTEDAAARQEAKQFVTDSACQEMNKEPNTPLEFVMACATDEDDEEVFDIG